ncbi:hypothetical protein BCR42DRAFT_421015 [Absidia repens]|uniref:GST N-terminal domain-containing protein n=1 Tax=Absidia repens TaxID=90262 RepID=A0A1X2I940_9FUNG|nr:hypothetical protein BCR42DRAFT_421015 [Absidia repens]
MASQQDIVLHWYPQSPYAQKIASILNYKKLQYKTVEISVMEPRPLRRPLDGGYTKTPILQIGNQVFCDSKSIISELEARYPEPSLYPVTSSGHSSKTLAFGVTHLLDTSVFMAIPTQFDLELLPKALLEDRAKMAGRSFDPAAQKALQPFLRLELQAQLGRLTQGMQHGKGWILNTATPSDTDFSLYMITFFMNMVIGEPWVTEHYPILTDHFERMQPFAQPDRTYDMADISAEDALQIAKDQQSVPAIQSVGAQDLLRIGQQVSVTPMDTGKTPAIGELVALTPQRVTIRTRDDRTGDVYVHFPLTAFLVVPVKARL